MRRIPFLAVMLVCLLPIGVMLASPAHAAKIGSVCKKLNAKDWDKNQPIVCKKNKAGKLVWTKFITSTSATKPTLTPSFENLQISLTVLNKTYSSTNPFSLDICNSRYGNDDLWSSTGIEVRDGSGILLATGSLGNATVIGHEPFPIGDCLFRPTLRVKKSDFYQISIGSWFLKSFSHTELAAQNWNLILSDSRRS